MNLTHLHPTPTIHFAYNRSGRLFLNEKHFPMYRETCCSRYCSAEKSEETFIYIKFTFTLFLFNLLK